MTLTKTQQALIDRAARHGGSAAVDCVSGRGPKGGRVSWGARERTALHALADAGLVELTGSIQSSDYNAGYGVHTTTMFYRLT